MRKGIKEKDIRDFEKYATKIDEVMRRILEYNPKAEIYLNMDDLQLLGDETYSDDGKGDVKYNEENVVASVWIRHSSGGEK